MPRYIVKTVPNKNKDIATGLLKGLANLLIFSMNGRIINPRGIIVCRAIPRSLLGTTRKIGKTGYNYHSGRILNGVEKGFAWSQRKEELKTPKPTKQELVPRITTGKIFKRSSALAGSHNSYDPYL